MEGLFQCQECPNKKTFPTRRRYTKHVRENHRKASISCSHCNYQTKFKVTLRRHIERHHSSNNTKPSQVENMMQPRSHKCPLCIFECASRQNMMAHYVNNHDISTDEQKFEFDDFSRFLKWKESVERSEVCQFFSRTGPADRRKVRIRYYRCVRDGHYQTRGKGLRHMKGSIKINSVCPATIKAVEDKATGVVRVAYIHTHVGHLQELCSNRSKTKRSEIAEKIATGVPNNEVSVYCEVECEETFEDANEIVICDTEEDSLDAVIVEETPKTNPSSCVKDLDEKKERIRSLCESLLERIQCEDEAEIVWKALLSIEAAFEETSSLSSSFTFGTFEEIDTN